MRTSRKIKPKLKSYFPMLSPKNCWMIFVRLCSLKEVLPLCLTEVMSLKKFLQQSSTNQKKRSHINYHNLHSIISAMEKKQNNFRLNHDASCSPPFRLTLNFAYITLIWNLEYQILITLRMYQYEHGKMKTKL